MKIDKLKKSWYSRVLLVIVLAAVIWVVWKNVSEISSYSFEFKYSYFIASSVVIILNYLFCFLIWHWLTASFGLHVPIFKAARGWFLSYLGKYVPGKIALLLVRMDAYSGYSGKKVAIATIVEYIVALIAACLVVLVSMLFSPEIVPDYVRWVAVLGTVLLLAVLYPPVLKKAVNLVLKLIGKAPLEEIPTFTKILLLVGTYIIATLIAGFALFLILNSLAAVSFKYYIVITGVYGIAGLVGLAAFFAPSGIGVREGVLFLILPAFIPEPAVIVGAIAIRLITTVTELLLAGFFVIMEHIHSRRKLEQNIAINSQ
ncbi:MAG: flippase-like domain-containing protein [Candidatus Aegiribacteria sp.]|nr:flippase-like domain-containing protein [Candidatus Aegiribacteria sp.]